MIKDLETTDLKKLVEYVELYNKTVGGKSMDKEQYNKQIKESHIHNNHKIKEKEMKRNAVYFALDRQIKNHYKVRRC